MSTPGFDLQTSNEKQTSKLSKFLLLICSLKSLCKVHYKTDLLTHCSYHILLFQISNRQTICSVCTYTCVFHFEQCTCPYTSTHQMHTLHAAYFLVSCDQWPVVYENFRLFALSQVEMCTAMNILSELNICYFSMNLSLNTKCLPMFCFFSGCSNCSNFLKSGGPSLISSSFIPGYITFFFHFLISCFF